MDPFKKVLSASYSSLSKDDDLNTLTAISPLDGRYWSKVSNLSNYFSEFSLIKARVKVEIEYFIALCELPLPQLKDFPADSFAEMRSWYDKFTLADAKKIKDTEKITNHDVKAVEYFVKEKFDEKKWIAFKEFIHFGLTSQDINNTAIPLLLKEAMDQSYSPSLLQMIATLKSLSTEWIDVPMLARTHGQPASPTKLGKELMVFVERLEEQVKLLSHVPHKAKFGGATGQFNAHKVAYPTVDWITFANSFVTRLGLQREQYTTQISHYDSLGALCDNLKRINTILIDCCRDFWSYISMDYFKQKINSDEVGSSAMPHKVNPIDFENAEGNLGLANAVFEHFSAKLPISRLQRDLTDSTVLRNLGVPFGHTLLSIISLQKALSKLIINRDRIHQDLEDNWVVISEAIQTVLRREAYPKPYEVLKKLTRTGQKITQQSMINFITNLDVEDRVKEELIAITPFNYTGLLPQK